MRRKYCSSEKIVIQISRQQKFWLRYIKTNYLIIVINSQRTVISTRKKNIFNKIVEANTPDNAIMLFEVRFQCIFINLINTWFRLEKFFRPNFHHILVLRILFRFFLDIEYLVFCTVIKDPLNTISPHISRYIAIQVLEFNSTGDGQDASVDITL